MNMRKVLYGLGMVATGIGIGAVTALLYAPKTGKETRKMLSRKAEDSMDFVSEQGREIRRQAEGAFEKGKEFAIKLVA
jgi:gas vesicle protein